MRISAFFVLIVVYLSGYAQPSDRTDQIRNLLLEYQYQSALDMINEQIKSGNNNKLNLYKGMALRGVLKYTDAIETFKTVLENDTNNMQALIEISNTYKILGDYNKVLKYLLKANSIHTNPTLLSEIASAYFTLEKYELARNIYLELLKQDSSNIYILRNIGICYEFADNTDSSIFYFEKVLESNSYDVQSVIKLCNLYIKKKNYSKGIELSDSFKSVDSSNSKINRLNAYLYFLNKDYNVSRSGFNSCIRSNDTSEFVLKYLGISYFKLEVFDTAQIYLEKAYFKDTTDAQTCYFLGMSCSASFYKELGIVYINKAIRLMNPSPEYVAGVYQNLAQSYNGYYKYQEALEALLKSYELNPNDTLILYKIGVQYDRWLNNKTMALSYYNDFLKLIPEHDKEIPKKDEELTITYYDIVIKRIAVLKEEIKKEKEQKTNVK